MKKKSVNFVLGAALYTVSTFAAAEGGYVGANLSFLDFSSSSGASADLVALSTRFGAEFNENLSGEFRVGFGVVDDTINGSTYELNTLFGIYIRGAAQISDTVKPYILLGASRGEVSSNGYSFTESDMSFGAGVDFKLSDRNSLNLEYMSLYDKDGSDITALALGFVTKL